MSIVALLKMSSRLYENAYESSHKFCVKKTCCRLSTKKASLQCDYAYVSLNNIYVKMIFNNKYTRTASLQCLRIWTFRLLLCLNDLLQSEQVFSFSIVSKLQLMNPFKISLEFLFRTVHPLYGSSSVASKGDDTLYDIELVCFITCLLKLRLFANDLLQYEHEYSSPVWVRIWIFMSFFCEKDLLQITHEKEKGFSPVWVRICLVSLLL